MPGQQPIIHHGFFLDIMSNVQLPEPVPGKGRYLSGRYSYSPSGLSLCPVDISTTTFSALLKNDSSFPLFPGNSFDSIFAATECD
jgi:hypothetical protein